MKTLKEKTTKKEFIEVLYEGLKESYPDCKSSINEQTDIILNKKTPTNIIGMLIQDDVKKWRNMKE